MPAFTHFLIIANVGIFLLQLAGGGSLIQWFALWPGDGAGLGSLPLLAPWQLVTYSFLHGNLMHLVFNMFALWMFGAELERVWGARRLATAYFASVVTGAVTHLLAAGAFGGGGGPVVGASAGVFGLLLAYAMLELVLGVTGTQSGVAHFAHLGGLLGGWWVYRFGRSRPPYWRG